jgi:hypothetical protein
MVGSEGTRQFQQKPYRASRNKSETPAGRRKQQKHTHAKRRKKKQNLPPVPSGADNLIQGSSRIKRREEREPTMELCLSSQLQNTRVQCSAQMLQQESASPQLEDRSERSTKKRGTKTTDQLSAKALHTSLTQKKRPSPPPV